MALEYFCCFNSYRKKTRNLSDSELGRLFRALMVYNETGEKTQLNGREETAFDFITEDIDAAKERYSEKCAKLSENGKKRKQLPNEEAIDSNCYQLPANAGKQKTKNKIYLVYLTIPKIYATLKAWLRASARLHTPQRKLSRSTRRTQSCESCSLSGSTTARNSGRQKPRALSGKTSTSWLAWQHKAA